MTGYNPISYHNGSVWPHDNALCAAGLMRYGLVDEAHRVMEGIVARRPRTSGTGCPSCSAGFAAAEFAFPVELPDVVLTAGVGRGVAAAVPPLDAALRARHPQGSASTSRRRSPSGSAGSASTASRSWAAGSAIEVDGDRVESISVPDHLQIVPTPLYDEAGSADDLDALVAISGGQASIRRPLR